VNLFSNGSFHNLLHPNQQGPNCEGKQHLLKGFTNPRQQVPYCKAQSFTLHTLTLN